MWCCFRTPIRQKCVHFYCRRIPEEFLKWIWKNVEYWNCAWCHIDRVGPDLASLTHAKLVLTFKAKPASPLGQALADRQLRAQGQSTLSSSPAVSAAISPGLLASLHSGFCRCSILRQGCFTSKSRQRTYAPVKEQVSKSSAYEIFHCGCDLWITSAHWT